MNNGKSTLVGRYARAFLHTFQSQMTNSDIEHLEACAKFLDDHHSWLFLCNLSLIPFSSKQQMIDVVCRKYQLISGYKMLFELLIQHQRVFLLPDVLRDIKKQYMRSTNMQIFTIESSCDLAPADRASLEKVLQKKIQQEVITCVYRVNPELIAGISISSETLRWEKSVRNDLINLRNAVRC